ncbi:aldehyde dehydrogenase family protein [Hymenobacter caeli]|uniref:Acyl-CoA reductase-like NAD-dependent aldehyde dehydrogenase n=1 Tax=Hymenobacter caeli TaxID=2735894 RepID=A0ABX2FM60_9BACT|nr:aldehyde dehydrogenase family protein [Hymenobacter caeli]NRT18022.1 acyl-CoA reductase-like NAD-dependent aldehyde dehydrogenase [Hymenobacter caeli]
MPKIVSPQVEFSFLLRQVKEHAPEIFDQEGRFLNLLEGRWQEPGQPRAFHSPVDGSELGALPLLSQDVALRAVAAAKAEAPAWAATDLAERQRRVRDCLDQLTPLADLIGKLLMWEIGKTYALGFSDIDRAIDGARWYVDHIGPMLQGRQPIGLVSNIASWNYPFSVLFHAVLVQALAGNAAIAKTPTDGGFISLSLAFAIARRCGLPVSLVSGPGAALSQALVQDAHVDALSFVGGRVGGRYIADGLTQQHKRYMLEMEGVNAYGVWNFSNWDLLAQHLRKGYDYGKQRCTAYVRFVVERRLFPQFLETYLGVIKSLKVGNPTLVDGPYDPLPELAFGPVINARQAEDLDRLYANALQTGATPLYDGQLDDALFLPGQDRSAYRAPRALVGLPRQSELYYKEPFGPIDSVVLVDRVEELVGEMNISNGALVAAVVSDDAAWAARTAKEIRAFKVGVNALRSRGDRAEAFGGLGESWKGAFVGGALLVEAVTQGYAPVLGNYPDATLLPEKI